MSLTAEQVAKFNDEGYLIIPDFADEATVESLKTECRRLVEEMNPEDHNTVFTTKEMKRTSDDYFMTSGDKIRYFFEDGAKDEKGNLKVDKHLSINKIGHALHVLSEPFKRFTFSDKIQKPKTSICVGFFRWILQFPKLVCSRFVQTRPYEGIAKSLNYVDPVVCQSMYIFKQPGIGGEVIPHQDSTFLHTNPMKLTGYWIALEDATLENGCLWFIPGSHKDGIAGGWRMVRKPDPKEGESRTMFIGENKKADNEKFIAGPVKKGSLVLIHGEVMHKSEKNVSQKSRHIYTFHCYEGHNTEYNKENWLQPAENMPFPKLYTA